MATHIPTTPPGVNELALSGFWLPLGATPVPTPLLTVETIAMLDAIPSKGARTDDDVLDEMRREVERQEAAARPARRKHSASAICARHIRHSPAMRAWARLRS